MIDMIVDLSNTYIYEYYQPDKAIDILDEVCAKASLIEDKKDKELKKLNNSLQKIVIEKKEAVTSQNFKKASKLKQSEKNLITKKNELEFSLLGKKKPRKITKEMIAEVIYLKTKIPVYEIIEGNKTKLFSLEKELLSKIIGQDEIIHDLCNLTKKIQLGFQDSPKIHTFLLAGSTGIGKTYLVKEYASLLYGKDHFIRLDMSEYKEEHSVSKILGAPPGYVGFDNHETILDQIRLYPHCVILLDEIEKASPSVLKLFLQVMDEGYLKDSKGRKVSFEHIFLFMTTNLGANKKDIGFVETVDSKNTDIEEFLGVEFVNRIDKKYYFKDLTKEDIERIVNLKLDLLINAFKKKNIEVEISTDIVEKIISKANYEKFGARQVDKVIDDIVTPVIVDAWYHGESCVSI